MCTRYVNLFPVQLDLQSQTFLISDEMSRIQDHYAALVWLGDVEVTAVADGKCCKVFQLRALSTYSSELLVTPGTEMKMMNTSSSAVLHLYKVLPISITKS